MKPAASDFLPEEIEVRRARRRTAELSLEHGRLVARVPSRIAKSELETLLTALRSELWGALRRKFVFDDGTLHERAQGVAQRWLADLRLPPFSTRFSSRQRKRWGSCTRESDHGRIRISTSLIGHPLWVLDQVLLHELIHLVVPHHGPQFHQLLTRGPHRSRAEGYLEALENVERMGDEMPQRLRMSVRIAALTGIDSEEGKVDLPLFARSTAQSELPPSALTARGASPELDSG